MDDYVFRHATIKDKDGILDILPAMEGYHGWDYLQTYIDHMFKCELFQSFVCVIGSEIIAFTSIQSINDGTVAIQRGSRVKKRYQGQQIYKRLSKYATKCAVDGKQFTKFVDVLGPFQNCAKHMYRNMFKRTIFKERYMVYFWGRDLQKFLQEPQTSRRHVSEISLCDMIDVCRNKRICDQLFPHNSIVVEWVPYELSESNIGALASDSTVESIFVIAGKGVELSLCSDTGESVNTSTDVEKNSGNVFEFSELDPVNSFSNPTLALSIGTIRRTFHGISCTLDYNGDDTFLEEHLMGHMTNLERVIEADDYVKVVITIDMSPTSADTGNKFFEFMSKIGLVKTRQNSLRVFEKVLRDTFFP